MGGDGSGRKKNPPKPTKLIKEIIPIDEIFTKEEAGLYHSLVDVYMSDFDRDDLSSGDMDDIMDLAKNRVLEFRLLKTAKDNPDRQLDLSGAVEKIRKENKTFKENLSTRRKDRIDPNEFKGFSIVDLAVAFDNNKKVELTEKALMNRKAEREAEEKRKDYTGNRYDIDVGTDGKKEDD